MFYHERAKQVVIQSFPYFVLFVKAYIYLKVCTVKQRCRIAFLQICLLFKNWILQMTLLVIEKISSIFTALPVYEKKYYRQGKGFPYLLIADQVFSGLVIAITYHYITCSYIIQRCTVGGAKSSEDICSITRVSLSFAGDNC